MKNYTKISVISIITMFAVITAVGVPLDSFAQSAEEIMKKSHLTYYYPGDDGVGNIEMKLTDKRGKERVRKFIMLRKDIEEGGQQKYFIYFIEPNDVRRMTFMVWKHVDKDDDRWIYIPSLDLVRRIAARDKNSSFVGSDFTYEDISGRHWTEDTHEILPRLETASWQQDVLEGAEVYVIKSTPVDPKNSKFKYKLSWIDKTRFLPLREEYYDTKEKLVRVFTADEIKKIDGEFIVTKRTMEDRKKGHTTVVAFSEIRLNVGIEDNIFTERFLRRPPAKYIK